VCYVNGFFYFTAKLNSDRVKGVVDHIMCLQELIERLHKLNVDNVEYAYLRALVLFSTGGSFVVLLKSCNLCNRGVETLGS